MTRGRSRLLGSSMAVAMMAVSARARATTAQDAAAAQALFEDGKRLMNAKDYARACPKFAESQRLDPGLGTVLWLGDCHAKNGQLASAWASFKDAEALATREKDSRVTVAREEAARLEPRLSKLTIRVPQAARIPGLEVQRDGAKLGEPLWGTAVPTDGGLHVIRASGPHKKPWEGRVQVPTEGGSAGIDIPVLEDAPDETERDGSTQRIVGLGLGGVGLVGLVVGTIVGLQVKPKADEADPFCRGNQCTKPGFDLRNDARSLATLSTIAFIAGGALLVGGGIVFFTAPHGTGAKAAVVPAATPTGGGAFFVGVF